jgi:hypothetical protein
MSNRPDWYIDRKFVREKTRHTWTDEEREMIYSLRKFGKPVDLIIQSLKLYGRVTRTQIYNIIREKKNIALGKCNCGTELTDGEKIAQAGKVAPKCGKCLLKNSYIKKQVREKNLSNGLCGVCGKNPVLDGHKTCKMCLSADYRRSYVQGMCGKCHTKPISPKSTVFCSDCLEKNRINAKEYREHHHCAGCN